MIKLTRLNQQVIVVNPDHVYSAEASPDTTLRLVGGEMILVRETLDELVEKVRAYRSSVLLGALGVADADAVAGAITARRHAHDVDEIDRDRHGRPSRFPTGGR
jgi:flagellar protein FlbD